MWKLGVNVRIQEKDISNYYEVEIVSGKVVKIKFGQTVLLRIDEYKVLLPRTKV